MNDDALLVLFETSVIPEPPDPVSGLLAVNVVGTLLRTEPTERVADVETGLDTDPLKYKKAAALSVEDADQRSLMLPVPSAIASSEAVALRIATVSPT